MPACQFDPHRVELGFGGSGDPLPAWEIDLGNGCTLVFRGRIDRIDLAQEPGAPDVVRCLVIDYKSSARQLDAVLLAHGLQLQLPAYLSVLQALPVDCLVPGARRLVPGGAFFVNLKGDASGASNRHDVLDTLPSDRNASYQHRGCYRSDFLPQLDSGFPAARSGQFAWSVNKSGELSRRPSDPRAPAEFEAMLRTLAETLRAMGRRICDGDIRVDPHQHKGKTACDACEFQSICRIDSWTHAYRQLGEENLPASPP
jgi:ATP-dependent helicase/nuclease subunit B